MIDRPRDRAVAHVHTNTPEKKRSWMTGKPIGELKMGMSNDNVAFPGEAFRTYVKSCYQENLLCLNRLVVGGERVHLGAITCAVLNIVAQMDHICAPKSASVLNQLVSSADKQLVILPGGHVGIVSGTGARKYLWPTIGDWLAARSGEPKPLAERGR